MGFGDELIASGQARGLAQQGKRAAFGDGSRIIWTSASHEIFRGNPNVARPGSEGAADLVWIENYRGNRPYGYFDGVRWHFRDFECPPGEIFLEQAEWDFAAGIPPDEFILVEPRVKPIGACNGRNKQWPISRYQQVAGELGRTCVQLVPAGAYPLLRGVEVIETPTFRHALAVLRRAMLYIGPEGGLHHGAAAVDVNACVLFGSFNTPRSTGYPWHENLTAGGEPCGRFELCDHCREAMQSISVDTVLAAVERLMEKPRDSRTRRAVP